MSIFRKVFQLSIQDYNEVNTRFINHLTNYIISGFFTLRGYIFLDILWSFLVGGEGESEA